MKGWYEIVHDKIINKNIRESIGSTTLIIEKLIENKPRWYEK